MAHVTVAVYDITKQCSINWNTELRETTKKLKKNKCLASVLRRDPVSSLQCCIVSVYKGRI